MLVVQAELDPLDPFMFMVVFEGSLNMASGIVEDPLEWYPGSDRGWRFEVFGCFLKDEEYAVSGFVPVNGAADRQAAGRGGWYCCSCQD